MAFAHPWTIDGPQQGVVTIGVPGERLLPTVEDTRGLGAELSALLGAGDVVVLDGPLGAGKTALTAGIAAGLGVRGRVTSPTFVIARRHAPASPDGPGLVHVDAYRLLGGQTPDAEQPSSADLADQLESLDLDSALDHDVVVVEWGAGFVDSLVTSPLVVTLERRPDTDVRSATWHRTGPGTGPAVP
ncbi:tRNA (adenosine(37)-N6)-threonylcarbamoyltransferase complex ATPase subunit type 1 TsaE [Dietzia sp. PP-33]|jgi:tRNA threonylcarbamoyladenosine biosynthesis protein TsaE|uniref:tRNA (adenosine(37)-N6)-threonylcarbamoyltransferase complex ATPase subunit type 1 TsaE n=1 Tax=Dietzia sp. PP-33 TaxID=2957500 RepID=UPI0029B7C590|nr:tRNA (adenosine(37)-N6)-threonylcarbamoyltransferase complex ATPase subunit type 1 TsaE [Dietzia sp. PP-33]MDX2356790.1 tRNA (adenosine(37)-N6)-threonylcarbamoyltransferase complex ATPase subunit type 1 TsaE [Dietzia sp. PP-33]